MDVGGPQICVVDKRAVPVTSVGDKRAALTVTD